MSYDPVRRHLGQVMFVRAGICYLKLRGSEVFGPPMNFPTSEIIASITIKSTASMAAIAIAGTHFVVQGTSRMKGT